jgi:hypothetical protein
LQQQEQAYADQEQGNVHGYREIVWVHVGRKRSAKHQLTVLEAVTHLLNPSLMQLICNFDGIARQGGWITVNAYSVLRTWQVR